MGGDIFVSMKSGLEGRNNGMSYHVITDELIVSMKSGLEGRNNPFYRCYVINLMKMSQ